MLISLEFPNGLRATKWGVHTLEHTSACDIPISSRRIAAAIAANFFNTKSIDHSKWGTAALSHEDVEELQDIFNTLSSEIEYWYVPGYVNRLSGNYDFYNDDSDKGRDKRRLRTEIATFLSAPLYFKVKNYDKIFKYLSELPYLGRTQSIFKSELVDENKVNLKNHDKYIKTAKKSEDSLLSIELKENSKIDEVIDVSPNGIRLTGAPKKPLPNGCERVWWTIDQTHQGKSQSRFIKPAVEKPLNNGEVFIFCKAPIGLTTNLTMNLLNRMNNLGISIHEVELSPIFSPCGSLLEGWDFKSNNPIDLMNLCSISLLRLKYEDSTFDYEIKIKSHNNKIVFKSKRLHSVTPLFVEDSECVEDVIAFINSNVNNIKDCKVTDIVETELGIGSLVTIDLEIPSEKIKIGFANNIGMGHLEPERI